MHPNRIFAWENEGEMLAFVADIAFCSIFVPGAVAHVPVTLEGRRLSFHVSRANRAAAMLDGATALVSCLGPDAYVSPDWYGTPDQVPTWNYIAVEAHGPVRRLSEPELVAQIDGLGAAHEARLAPKRPWTRDKMAPGRFDAMLRGIVGFEVALDTLRGTRKLGQHKSSAERRNASAAMEAAGRRDIAAAMRAASDAR